MIYSASLSPFFRLSLCLAGGCDHREQPKRGRAERARASEGQGEPSANGARKREAAAGSVLAGGSTRSATSCQNAQGSHRGSWLGKAERFAQAPPEERRRPSRQPPREHRAERSRGRERPEHYCAAFILPPPSVLGWRLRPSGATETRASEASPSSPPPVCRRRSAINSEPLRP